MSFADGSQYATVLVRNLTERENQECMEYGRNFIQQYWSFESKRQKFMKLLALDLIVENTVDFLDLLLDYSLEKFQIQIGTAII